MRFTALEDTRLIASLRVGTLLEAGLVLFFSRLILAIVANPRMLTPAYGRVHRLVGTFMLLYMLLGACDVRSAQPLIPPRLAPLYDAGLSCLGFAAAYSAARAFGRAKPHAEGSAASGILDEAATVSVHEMIEHCFYQLLNLAQILYLYTIAALPQHPITRYVLCVGMLLPWLARSRFPVNSFSDNYAKPGVGGTTPLIRLLYRFKKWQYLLYKHCLLHGLNVSVALDGLLPDGHTPLVAAGYFRSYWVCLNIAYVNEFFMQTLVKRKYMSQGWMMTLQQVLMLVSTVFALQVLAAVHVLPAALSFALNFLRRGHEVSNGVVVLTVAVATDYARRYGGLDYAGAPQTTSVSAARGAVSRPHAYMHLHEYFGARGASLFSAA